MFMISWSWSIRRLTWFWRRLIGIGATVGVDSALWLMLRFLNNHDHQWKCCLYDVARELNDDYIGIGVFRRQRDRWLGRRQDSRNPVGKHYILFRLSLALIWTLFRFRLGVMHYERPLDLFIFLDLNFTIGNTQSWIVHNRTQANEFTIQF